MSLCFISEKKLAHFSEILFGGLYSKVTFNHPDDGGGAYL
jgi:hypothetical protein